MACKKKKKKINEIIENATVASGLEQMAVSQEELPGVVLPINQIGRVTSSEGSEAASLSPAPLAPCSTPPLGRGELANLAPFLSVGMLARVERPGLGSWAVEIRSPAFVSLPVMLGCCHLGNPPLQPLVPKEGNPEHRL